MPAHAPSRAGGGPRKGLQASFGAGVPQTLFALSNFNPFLFGPYLIIVDFVKIGHICAGKDIPVLQIAKNCKIFIQGFTPEYSGIFLELILFILAYFGWKISITPRGGFFHFATLLDVSIVIHIFPTKNTKHH